MHMSINSPTKRLRVGCRDVRHWGARRHAMRLLFFVVIFAITAFAQNPAQSAVQQVLEKQQDAWNRHDLEAFMSGYWNSPQLTFFSGANVTTGWQATLERYRKRYQSE